jgi:hypothetical protein
LRLVCCEGGGVLELNVAVQVLLASMETTVAQPVPLQPTKDEPLAAVAVRVTLVMNGYCARQEVPQWMPAGLDVTVPMPLPPRTTVRERMPPTSTTEFPVSRVTYAVVPLGLMAMASGAPLPRGKGMPITVPVAPSSSVMLSVPWFTT